MTAAKRRFLGLVLGPAAALAAVWLLLAVTASASPPAPVEPAFTVGPLITIAGPSDVSDTLRIDLAKTVGVGPACSAFTTTSVIVLVGTPVRYCYTVYNHGTITLTRHSVYDDQLGDLLIDKPHVLAPGNGVQFSVVFTPSASVNNSATWTAYNPGPTDVVSDTKTATVTVLIPYAHLPLFSK